MIFDDSYFMKMALQEAHKAMDADEVPIGCIIVQNNKVIARAYNQTETLKDPTAHAEILAITSACNQIGAKYLPDATLYVTVEPCLMCAGAILLSQIQKIVIGCGDNKRGYSQFVSNERHVFHPKASIINNVLENECSELMKSFFKSKRIK